MDVGCLEIVVKRKNNTLMRILPVAAVILAVCFVDFAFFGSSSEPMTVRLLLMLLCAGSIVLAYLAWLNADVEYEYAYVDKEFRIARILRKERRKEIGTYDLTALEIMAPLSSHHLDAYRNRKLTVHDYSSGAEEDKGVRYAVILSNDTELLLDLSGEYADQILRLLRMHYPSKVHTN